MGLYTGKICFAVRTIPYQPIIVSTYLSIGIFQLQQSFCNGFLAKLTAILLEMLRYKSYLFTEIDLLTEIFGLYRGDLHEEKRNIIIHQRETLEEENSKSE